MCDFQYTEITDKTFPKIVAKYKEKYLNIAKN